jgi:hypothetical protein
MAVNAVRAASPATRPVASRHSIAALVDGVVIQRLHLAEANADVDETSFLAVRDALLAARAAVRLTDYRALKTAVKVFTPELAAYYTQNGRSLRSIFDSDQEEREAVAGIFCHLRETGDPGLAALIRDIRLDGATLAAVYRKAQALGKSYVNEIVALQTNHPVLGARAGANETMRAVVGQVSLPSAAHRLELINAKYADVAAHGYGFSFCATDTMQADVDQINAYLRLVRDDPNAALDHVITWQWSHVNGQRVEFTLNGRDYSTHVVPGHSQLYPLRGAGVTHVNGPVDMANRLGAANLSEAQKVKLFQVYCARNGIPHNDRPPNQLGAADWRQYVDRMNTLLGL